MEQSLSNSQLERQNISFRGTGGISGENGSSGFQPAFLDTVSKVVHISTFRNGKIAPIHLLDGVPDEWVMSRDAAGHVVNVIGTVIVGFIRNEQFYTREQVVNLMADGELH